MASEHEIRYIAIYYIYTEMTCVLVQLKERLKPTKNTKLAVAWILKVRIASVA